MKKTIFRKIQFASNIAVIIIAILLSVITVKQFLPTVSSNVTATRVPSVQSQSNNLPVNLVGKSISLKDVNWGKHKKNLVLYISNTCHFCSESSPFYKQLVKTVADKDVNLMAVLPQTVEEGREYLKKLDVKIENIYQSSSDTMGVRGTPTLLLTDENGVITDFWMGKLQPEREEQVLSKLKA